MTPATLTAADTARKHEYPRPQLRRAQWESLNGLWLFHIDAEGRVERPSDIKWGGQILVPFSPETKESGVADQSFYRVCWYRRSFTADKARLEDSVLLHFGAVDYQATVWINDRYAGSHTGGYTPFTIDVTEFLTGEGEQVITVRAEDDPFDLEKPRGKQDWQLKPHSIWYPRTTGIWQTVWLERVPRTRIARVCWTPSLLRWEIGFDAWLEGPHREGLSIELELECNGRLVARDRYSVDSNEVHRRLALSDPGIDDFRNEMLWSPESPRLIEARIRLVAGEDETVDEVSSYTALRSISIEVDRFVLNGRPYPLRMILDQGYWPDTGLTAPDDQALRRDVELAKAMGFNGVRKHQKIEDPRYLYWADHLGLLVWGEMPSAYRFTQTAVQRTMREWGEALSRDVSHPCIIAWVPLNESWGVPNLPNNPVERNYVQTLFYLTKTLDPSRPVVGNDGWESVATDIIGIHDYDSDPERLAHRYHGDRLLPHLLRKERPGGRLLIVGDHPQSDHPILLSEFGGITVSDGNCETWGYSSCSSPKEFERLYGKLMDVVRSLGMLTGFCYTQFTDTYQEANGLLYADRRPKFPIESIRSATIGHLEGRMGGMR